MRGFNVILGYDFCAVNESIIGCDVGRIYLGDAAKVDSNNKVKTISKNKIGEEEMRNNGNKTVNKRKRILLSLEIR